MMGLGLRMGLSRPPSGPAELVTNGGFDADANWTKALGSTISGGVLNASTASAFALFASQAIPFVSGGVYQLIYTVTVTSGGIIPTYTTPGVTNLTTRTASGTYTQQIAASNAHTLLAFNSGGSGFTGTVDNVSLKRIS